MSNTPVVSESIEGATKTYVFKETKPLPSYLIAFGVDRSSSWMRERPAGITFRCAL